MHTFRATCVVTVGYNYCTIVMHTFGTCVLHVLYVLYMYHAYVNKYGLCFMCTSYTTSKAPDCWKSQVLQTSIPRTHHSPECSTLEV